MRCWDYKTKNWSESIHPVLPQFNSSMKEFQSLQMGSKGMRYKTKNWSESIHPVLPQFNSSMKEFQSLQMAKSKRRRFNPLQGLRRIFRKKSRASNVLPVPDASSSPNEPSGAVSDQMSPADPMRSRSTSQLSDSGDPASLKNRTLFSKCGFPLKFCDDPECEFQTRNPWITCRLLELQLCWFLVAKMNVCVQVGWNNAELLDVVRRRKLQREDTSDDEDLGLPRSPLSTSPHHKTITNHSTCSEGSLLSMGSSELEDDSGVQNQSRHSSKVSLYEKKLTITHDSDAELNISLI
ncbi:uncharacterized protein LOC103512596 [Diaphorina citri]|uniref:Uncharacterized protein LOC103512596 n=1 Tax=Diaphorina citri TaxID=121845 RepID=A0A3Q0J044_DIACI|nr:uncharacterized protein LOC103512596 [Diaphorina citri]